MPQPLLAPLGRAEPDDVQGWLEHGGALALQRALALPSDAMRARLNGVPRRDGRGPLHVEAQDRAAIDLAAAASLHPTRTILREIPLWLVEGALLLALASEQVRVSLHVGDALSRATHKLMSEVLAGLRALGFIGKAGWAGGVEVQVTKEPAPAAALDGVTTLLLPHLLWQQRDPGTTLLAVQGAVDRPALYEIPLGLPLRRLLPRWRSESAIPTTVHLGNRRLTTDEWALPLDFEHFGSDLGSGRLDVEG